MALVSETFSRDLVVMSTFTRSNRYSLYPVGSQASFWKLLSFTWVVRFGFCYNKLNLVNTEYPFIYSALSIPYVMCVSLLSPLFICEHIFSLKIVTRKNYIHTYILYNYNIYTSKMLSTNVMHMSLCKLKPLGIVLSLLGMNTEPTAYRHWGPALLRLFLIVRPVPQDHHHSQMDLVWFQGSLSPSEFPRGSPFLMVFSFLLLTRDSIYFLCLFILMPTTVLFPPLFMFPAPTFLLAPPHPLLFCLHSNGVKIFVGSQQSTTYQVEAGSSSSPLH